MSIEYQRIVEDIQTLLSADTDPTESALKDVYERYVDAVTRTNVRLEECDRLLNQGLRAEAIHKSEMEPNLLDVTGILDFPEREPWADYVRQYQLPEPPEPKLDVAQEINEAYSQEQPLAQLMRVHRLHALARSSLRNRIDVMRKISQLDTGNPIWQEDIKRFEQARHAELPGELNAALKASDASAVGVLQQEVSSADWLEPPSQALANQVANAHNALRVKQSRTGLSQIAAELNEAYGNFEVDRARTLRAKWDELAPVGIEGDSDELAEQVAPALDWLDEQDAMEQTEAAYQKAVGNLESALDKSATRADLDRLYHAVLKFDRGIPDLLAERLQKRASSIDAAEKRKTRFVVIGVVASVLFVAAIVTLFIISSNRKAEQEKRVTDLRKLIDAKLLDEAETYLTAIKDENEDVYKSPEIQELAEELKGLQGDEEQRLSDRSEAIESAQRMGIDEFSWDNIITVDELLERAKELSRTDSELAKVDLLTGQVQGKRTSEQRTIDDAFRKAFADFQAEVNSFDPFDGTEIERMLKVAMNLRQWPRADGNERRKVEPFIEDLKKKQKDLVNLNAETALLNSITHSVGNRTRYAARLQEYVDKVQDRPQRVADIQRVLANEKKLWEGVERWSSLATDWAGKDLAAVGPEDAGLLIRDANLLMKDHPGFPGQAKLTGFVRHLEKVSARRNKAQELGVLYSALNSREMKDLKMLRTSSGEKYYFSDKVPKPRFPGSDEWRVYYYKDFAYDDLESAFVKEAEIANRRTPEGTFDWTSPQASLATFVLGSLSKLKDDNWNETFEAILTKLRADTATEPLLTIQLIKLVLDIAVKGDSFIEQALAQHVAVVANSSVNSSANWIDPKNAEGVKARRDAVRAIATILAFRPAYAQAAKQYTALKNPSIGTSYEWIGWLRRDDKQRWTCATAPNLSLDESTTALVVVYKEASDDTIKFSVVGQAKGGVPMVSAESTPKALVEGRPVYRKVEQP